MPAWRRLFPGLRKSPLGRKDGCQLFKSAEHRSVKAEIWTQLHTFYEGDTRDLSTLSSQLGAPQSAFEARAFDVSAPRRGSVPGVSPHRRALDLVLSLSYDRCTPRSTISALPCHRCRDRTVTGKGSTRPRWPKTACVPPGG